jgi:hypothetical protein
MGKSEHHQHTDNLKYYQNFKPDDSIRVTFLSPCHLVIHTNKYLWIKLSIEWVNRKGKDK